MKPFVELGFDYFMFDCGGFPELITLEMLLGEVLPGLADIEENSREGSTIPREACG